MEGLNRRYKDSKARKSVIDKIRDIRNGDAFEQYKEKFYVSNNDLIDDEVKRKLFIDYKILDQVINYFTSFCPTLAVDEPKGDNDKKREEKKELVKLALKTIKWDKINSQIYDILESEGDAFFYIYFSEEKNDSKYTIPRISLLDSYNMNNILLSDNNEVEAYVYKENVIKEVLDLEKGDVKPENLGEYTYIFTKGLVYRYTLQKKEKGVLSVDKDGELKIVNKSSYDDEIPIIHIPSIKYENEKFSVIPAEDYISVCLNLMQIQSDIRATNRQLGFPRITLLDAEYVDGDGKIGGVRIAKTSHSDDDFTNSAGQVIQHSSATNESFFTEEDRAIDYLYNLVGVTNPSLMKRVGSSDSSKVLQQVNARMERKIERYIDNIIDAFKIYFKILFKENGLYDNIYDSDYSFVKPRSIIKNSVYDDMLLDNLEITTGQSTIADLLRRNGKNEEEIAKHFEQMNKEVINGSNDISVGKKEPKKEVVNTVQNSNSKTIE